ncbi:hypothetical protein Ddc_21365 [Ditylenchus destructor]|nr:hypothetical protein Ddc_21365 [Ditylenchus destructor]
MFFFCHFLLLEAGLLQEIEFLERMKDEQDNGAYNAKLNRNAGFGLITVLHLAKKQLGSLKVLAKHGIHHSDYTLVNMMVKKEKPQLYTIDLNGGQDISNLLPSEAIKKAQVDANRMTDNLVNLIGGGEEARRHPVFRELGQKVVNYKGMADYDKMTEMASRAMVAEYKANHGHIRYKSHNEKTFAKSFGVEDDLNELLKAEHDGHNERNAADQDLFAGF